MKTSIFIVAVACVISLIACQAMYQLIRCDHGKEHKRKEYFKVIDDKVEIPSKPPILIRLKGAYVHILCYGYTSLTVLLLHNVHCIRIADESFMFLDASVPCSSRKGIMAFCILMLLCWCLMFVLALFVGCRWLSCCKITVNRFLVMITVPPSCLLFWIRIQRKKKNHKSKEDGKLRYDEAKDAKYILRAISEPYRFMKDNQLVLQQRRRGKRVEPSYNEVIVWDCVYLLRCFALSLACVLPNESLNRLLWTCTVLLFFLVLQLHVHPYKMARVNQIETYSVVALLLMSFSCFIMNSHVESSIIVAVTNFFVVLSFIPLIAYTVFILIDFIFVYLMNHIKAKVN